MAAFEGILVIHPASEFFFAAHWPEITDSGGKAGVSKACFRRPPTTIPTTVQGCPVMGESASD